MSGMPRGLTVDNFDEHLESQVDAYERARQSSRTRDAHDLEHFWRRLAALYGRSGSTENFAMERRFAVAMTEAIEAICRVDGAA